MEQKKIDRINELYNEREEYRHLEIPQNESSQKLLLRDLMNIREPKRINKDFLQIQDEYLQEETKEKGVTYDT